MLSTVHLHQCFSYWGNFNVSWLSNCFRWKPAGNPVVKTLVSGENFPDQQTHWFYSAMNSARIKEPLGRSLARRSLRFIYQIVKIEVRQKLGNWPNVAIPNPSKLDHLTGCLVVPYTLRKQIASPNSLDWCRNSLSRWNYWNCYHQYNSHNYYYTLWYFIWTKLSNLSIFKPYPLWASHRSFFDGSPFQACSPGSAKQWLLKFQWKTIGKTD